MPEQSGHHPIQDVVRSETSKRKKRSAVQTGKKKGPERKAGKTVFIRPSARNQQDQCCKTCPCVRSGENGPGAQRSCKKDGQGFCFPERFPALFQISYSNKKILQRIFFTCRIHGENKVSMESTWINGDFFSFSILLMN